jgi:hypothetical protein
LNTPETTPPSIPTNPSDGTPLAATTEVGMIKLRHLAITIDQGLQQRHHGVGADRVAMSHFINSLAALVG